MANDSPKRDYRTARDRLRERHENGIVSDEDYEYIETFLDAYDPEVFDQPTPEDGPLEWASLKSYCSRYTWVSHRMDGETLTSADIGDINDHMSDLMRGDNPHIKNDGFSESTVALYQSALRSFYAYHDDLEIDPENITIIQPDESTVDPEELFTDDEVQAMRQAASNVRNRAILELFLNTGQRIRAIQTLRVTDVDVENGRFRLNPDVDGLKHAKGMRPLLGATGPVRDWLEYHPQPDPDTYLIVGLHQNNREPGEMLSAAQYRRILAKIATEADVDKPANPHQFRHYAVTSMYRDYGLELDQIRWLVGHGEDSRMIETTYRHLTDEDRIEDVEIDAGFREPDEDSSPLTPPACTTCHEPLPDDAKACPRCGEVYTPDARAAADQIDEAFYEGKGATADDDTEAALDVVRELLTENPDTRAELIADLTDDDELASALRDALDDDDDTTGVAASQD